MENTIQLFLIISGFIIGLGAVTVIDLHGFLAQKSEYWTLATIRAHKITKPLIWLGTGLLIAGTLPFYQGVAYQNIQLLSLVLMVLNGLFLTFKVSRFLLKKEKSTHPESVLPKQWQQRIALSFMLSFVLWWGNVAYFVWVLSSWYGFIK